MKIVRVLCLSALIASAQPALAQVCSGGTEGGMDATGNLCSSTPAALAADPIGQVPAAPAVRVASAQPTAAAAPSTRKVAAVWRVSHTSKAFRLTVR